MKNESCVEKEIKQKVIERFNEVNAIVEKYKTLPSFLREATEAEREILYQDVMNKATERQQIMLDTTELKNNLAKINKTKDVKC